MISYANHKEPDRMLRLAVLDDVTPADKGTALEYWRGPLDFEPTGKRAAVFKEAMRLYEAGRLVLCQKREGDGMYSYMGVVTQ